MGGVSVTGGGDSSVALTRGGPIALPTVGVGRCANGQTT
jgi:hypothetical protein